MAELSTLARPYAKAAFDYADEHQVADDWQDFLFVASHIVKDPSFSDLLDNPEVAAEKKASALVELYDTQVAVAGDSAFKQLLAQVETHRDKNVAERQFPKVSVALNNFVTQLAEQERLALLPQVYEHFRRHKAQSSKQIEAYITSAYPLTKTQHALIQARLASSLNANVVLHQSVDASLLAGATIKIGDKIVDDSIRGKLKQLKTQLTA